MLNLPFFKTAQATKTSVNALGESPKARSLAQTPPGQTVMITGFGQLKPALRQHLQAYGVLPGRTVRVLAQRPVTVIQIEYTELAFEGEIARHVSVE